MADFEPREVLEEELQSPRSPVPSSYAGSDAADDVAPDQGENVGQLVDEELDMERLSVDEIEHEYDTQMDVNAVVHVDDIQMDVSAVAHEDDTQMDVDAFAHEDDTQMEEYPENAPQTLATDEQRSQKEEDNETESKIETTSAAAIEEAATQVQTGSAADEGPRYKYKYPEAYPTPPGWDDEVWNRAYTAADSRIYNHAKKNHQVSKQKRLEGVTREEALQWERERPEREARRVKRLIQQRARGGISSSAIAPTLATSTHTDNMANKKTQKPTKRKPETASSVGSAQQSSMAFLNAPSPSEFGLTLTLADRIKGKAAASAAASYASTGGSSVPFTFGAGAEKASKRGGGSAKKQPNGKANVIPPPIVKPQATFKVTPSKPRASQSGTPASALDLLQPDEVLELFSDDEADDDDNLYCVCRGPQSINMILCDGCQEWFHRRPACIGEGDPALYKNFAKVLDQWYCPPCKEKNPSFQVTYFRLCRRPGCKNPALVDQDPPSKYCSEECGIQFFQDKLAEASTSTESSRGGALSQLEIALVLNSTQSASEFKQLGKTAPKFKGKGKVVSKQFLRDLTSTGSTSAGVSDGSANGAGKVYENRAEYKAKAADDEWERKTVAEVAKFQDEANYYNQAYDGPILTTEQFADVLHKALAESNVIIKENYLDVDWHVLQIHGVIDGTEAETIHDLQELMKYSQYWIQVAELRILYTKAIIQKSTEILKTKGTAPKITCGFLPKISISDILFDEWITKTDDGAKFAEWATSGEGAKFRDWSYSREGSKYQQGGDHDKRLVVGSQIEKWGKNFGSGICEHSVKKHTTHFKWAEVHDRDNARRKHQLTEDFNARLKELNGVMHMIDQRLVNHDWNPIGVGMPLQEP